MSHGVQEQGAGIPHATLFSAPQADRQKDQRGTHCSHTSLTDIHHDLFRPSVYSSQPRRIPPPENGWVSCSFRFLFFVFLTQRLCGQRLITWHLFTPVLGTRRPLLGTSKWLRDDKPLQLRPHQGSHNCRSLTL